MTSTTHKNLYLNLPLYPDCYLKFIQESGRARTQSTRDALKVHCAALQRLHPAKRVRNFKIADLAAYCTSNDAASATQKCRRSLLQTFFSWCTFTGLVLEDPSRDLKFLVNPRPQGVRRHTWLTADEFRQLLRGLPAGTLRQRRDRMIVYVGTMVGIRRVNLATLRWSMFTPGLESVRLTTKGTKLAEFGIPDLLLGELKSWRDELEPHQGVDGPVFPTFHTEITADRIYEDRPMWDRSLQANGIGKVVSETTERVLGIRLRPHDLRRSYASYLESEGYTVRDIQRALGHENVATTSVYLDRNPERAIAVGRSLNVRL